MYLVALHVTFGRRPLCIASVRLTSLQPTWDLHCIHYSFKMAHRLTAPAMLSLPRPGAAQANENGSHYITPWSSFDFSTQRTSKNVAIGHIPRPGVAESTGKHDPPPVENILEDLRYLDVAFLDNDTVLYLRPRGAEVGKPDVDVTLSDKKFKEKLGKDEEEKPGQEIWCKTLDGVDYKIGEVPVP